MNSPAAGRLLATTAAVLATAALTAPAAPAAGGDLVLGLPWAAEGSVPGVGAVAIVPGSKERLLGVPRVLTRSDLGLGDARPFLGVGSAVARGDFDGDRKADLAVGAWGAAAVRVLYGSGAAATLHGPAPDSTFGAALAAGDLDRDGFADLVVGDTGADARAEADYGAGAVHVLRGGPTGLTDERRTTLGRPDPAYSAFGSRLALGDTDRDGRLDVYEASEGAPVWSDDPPTPGHLTASHDGATVVTLAGRMEGGPASLAIGDVDGDGYRDLVAGVPVDGYVGEDERFPAGSVRIHRGGPDGVARKPVVVRQSTRGVPGTDEPADRFGQAVAVARIDGDRYADIVVGAPDEDAGRGRVTILRGGPGRGALARHGHVVFDQATAGIPGARRPSNRFGAALALLDLTGDRVRELVVSAPGDDRGAGAVTALRGIHRGVTSRGAKRLLLRSLGLKSAERYAWPETRLGS
jgi:hypothetical protein